MKKREGRKREKAKKRVCVKCIMSLAHVLLWALETSSRVTSIVGNCEVLNLQAVLK